MDKQGVIKDLRDGFDRLLAATAGMDDRQMRTPFYGAWGVKDVLAHIAGWQRAMTDAMQRMARGERPTPEGVDYSDADAWNAKFAAAMTPQAAETVVAELRQSFANYLRAAEAIPDERYGEGKTINRLLETSGWGHYREHLPAIEEYRKKIGL